MGRGTVVKDTFWGIPPGRRIEIHIAGMFVIVAVDTEKLPIAAIGRIIVVVVISVVYGEFMDIVMIELPGTTAANPRKKLERLFAVASFALCAATLRFSDNTIKTISVHRSGLLGHELAPFSRLRMTS